MNKGLLLLYGSLFTTVLILRQLDLSTIGINKMLSKQFFDKSEDNLSLNTTSAKRTGEFRNLATASQNPTRVEICDAADDDGTVSQSQKDKAKKARDEYRNAFGSAIGDDLVKGNTPEIGSQVQKIIIIAILLIFFIFTPILTMCYCCYCCCDNKCPCCCKRDPVKQPFSKKEMLCNLIFLIIYCALTFSASVAGYVYSNQINSSYKSVKCSVVAALDDLNIQKEFTDSKGVKSVFLGLNGLKDEISTISGEFDAYFTSVQKFCNEQNASGSSNIEAVENLNGEILNMLESLRTVLPAQQSYAYDPSDGLGFNKDITSSPEDSLFYAKKYYDPKIEAVKQAQDQVASGAVTGMRDSVTQAQDFIDNDKSTYTTPLSDAQKQITDGQTMISDQIDNIDSNTSSVDTVFSLVTVFLMVFYGIFMFIAVVGAFVSFIGYIKSWYKVRYCLNGFFCLLGFLTFIGFLICIVLGILSIFMMETCETSDKMLNDKTYLLSIDSLDKDLVDYLTTCKVELQGDGQILKKFKIQDQVDKITQTQEKLTDAFNSFDLTAYKKFEDYMTYFKFIHEMMRTYGIFYERKPTEDFTAVKPNEISNDMTISLDYQTATAIFTQQRDWLNNKGSSNPYGACISASNNDKFVFLTSQCSVFNPTLGQPTFASAISGTSCLDRQAYSTDMDNSASVTSRYVGCPTIKTAFYDRMKTYISQVPHNLDVPENFSYQKKDGTPVGPINKKRDSYIDDIQVKQSSTSSSNGLGEQLTKFKAAIQTTVLGGSQKITDSLIGANGLMNKVNCLFFGATIDNFQEQMCSNSALSIYDTFKIMLVVCFSNFTLIIFLYKMSMKFLGKKKEGDSKPNQGTIMPGIEMQKQF